MDKIFTQWHSAAETPSVTQAVIWNCSNWRAMALPDPLMACWEVPRQFLPLLPRSVPTVKPLILSPLWTFGQSMAKTAAAFLGPLCILHVYTHASPLSPDKPS